MPVKLRTSAPMPRLSAYRAVWQVNTSPSPSVLRVVSPCTHCAGSPASTWSTLSSAASVSGSGAGSGVASVFCGFGEGVSPWVMPLVSSAGRTPAASVTSEPETTTAATAAAAPTVVCSRRRAEPARVRIEGRGQRTLSSAGARASSWGRTAVEATSRWTENCAVAACSSRSAVARVVPASRAIWSMGSEVRWLSSSTRRWVVVSLPSASRVARTPGSRSFCRDHQRVLLRRCARAQASGRT